MNIDKLIFPRFKRFQTMNLGLKRLFFLLTFTSAILGVGAAVVLEYSNFFYDGGFF
jgi:hypothetical protein